MQNPYLNLSTVHTDKSKVEISKNFVAFSEYMNFTVDIKLEKFKFIIYHAMTGHHNGMFSAELVKAFGHSRVQD